VPPGRSVISTHDRAMLVACDTFPKGRTLRELSGWDVSWAVVTANFVHTFCARNEPVYFERTVVSDDLLSESGRDNFWLSLVSGAGTPGRTGYCPDAAGFSRAKRVRAQIRRWNLFLEKRPPTGGSAAVQKNLRQCGRQGGSVEEIDVLVDSDVNRMNPRSGGRVKN